MAAKWAAGPASLSVIGWRVEADEFPRAGTGEARRTWSVTSVPGGGIPGHEALVGANGNLEKYRREIRDEARRRGVETLMHFTPLVNLRSILEHGLVSRQALADGVADGVVSDARRLDGRPECICLSVEGINHAMFRAKRRRGGQWAVLAVDVSVIWENHCRFCWQNAASTEILKANFIGGPWAFRRMFADYKTFRSRPETERGKYSIPDNRPTDSGAEVQVYGRIGIEKITAIGVGSRQFKTELEINMKKLDREIPVEVVEWIR